MAGAGFTVTVSVAAGLILIRRLKVVLNRTEEVLFGFLVGSAIVSFLVFLLCVVHRATLPVFLIGGAGVVTAAFFTRSHAVSEKMPFGRRNWLLLSLVLPLLVVYLANSLAPEVSPDGSGYHLGNVTRMWERHGFVWDYHSIYSYLSQGIEMLYLVAFSIGGMPAAATFHLSYLVCLTLLLASFGQRFGFPRAGAFAAVLVFASPVVGLVAVSAYNDVALATCIFAVFYLGELNLETSCGNQLILNGFLVGFCYALKYPGALILLLVLLQLRGKGFVRLAAPAALMAAPWMLRNWYWLGNPFAPFFNRWFPNPFYPAEAEASYLRELRTVDGGVFDLVVTGAKLPGLVGPVFLLAPFALLALRYPVGRRLLLGAAVFTIPAVLNPGARFLIPALPFAALAMGVAMQNSPGAIPVLAAFHVLLGFPAVMPSYCAPWAWRIREAPVKVALGLAPEQPYIERYLPDYWLKQTIEKHVPKGERVFALAGLPEAYIDRRIVVGYESAEGLKGGEGFRYFVLNEDSNLPGLSVIEKKNGKALYLRD